MNNSNININNIEIRIINIFIKRRDDSITTIDTIIITLISGTSNTHFLQI